MQAARSLDASVAGARKYTEDVVLPTAWTYLSLAAMFLRDVALPAAASGAQAAASFAAETALPAARVAASRASEWATTVALPAAADAYVVMRDVVAPQVASQFSQLVNNASASASGGYAMAAQRGDDGGGYGGTEEPQASAQPVRAPRLSQDDV